MKIARLVVVCVLALLTCSSAYAGTSVSVSNLQCAGIYSGNWSSWEFFEGWSREAFAAYPYATSSYAGDHASVNISSFPSSPGLLARLVPMYPLTPGYECGGGVGPIQFDWNVQDTKNVQLQLWAINGYWRPGEDTQYTRSLVWYNPRSTSLFSRSMSGHVLIDSSVSSNWVLEVTTNVVPEPSGIIALISGMAGMGFAVIRRKR